MPTVDFFARLGLFGRRGFLDAAECQRFRDELAAFPVEMPKVVKADGTQIVDEYSRRTRRVAAPAALEASAEARLLAIKPEIDSHFHISLRGCQPVQFLCYREGDFFRPHPDARAGPNAPDFMSERQVSVVIFLNGESDAPSPNCYCGGALTFYGLLDGPAWENLGLPLRGEEGLLVAFASTILHEVTPVTSGTRHTIVSWYY